MTISPDAQGWYSLERGVDPEIVRQLAQIGPVAKLSVSGIPLITVKFAQRFSGLRVEQLRLWSEVTRRAIRHVVQLPGLRVLDVLCLRGPGRLASFGKARDLEVLRVNNRMSESDLLEIARCPQLRELGAQNAELTLSALSALLALPSLASLDLEGTRFDDRMARRIGRSTTITSLDLGATRITRVGLAHLVQMQQLRSLDLWATALDDADLRLLLELPGLEYVSLGGHGGIASLNPNGITQLILESKSLKRVWLDGMRLDPGQEQALEARLEHFRITPPDDDD